MVSNPACEKIHFHKHNMNFGNTSQFAAHQVGSGFWEQSGTNILICIRKTAGVALNYTSLELPVEVKVADLCVHNHLFTSSLAFTVSNITNYHFLFAISIENEHHTNTVR